MIGRQKNAVFLANASGELHRKSSRGVFWVLGLIDDRS
jgi:hypothetical protein